MGEKYLYAGLVLFILLTLITSVLLIQCQSSGHNEFPNWMKAYIVAKEEQMGNAVWCNETTYCIYNAKCEKQNNNWTCVLPIKEGN